MTGHLEATERLAVYQTTDPVTRRSRRGTVITLTLLVAVLAAGAGSWFYDQHKAPAQQASAPPPPAVTVSPPIQRSIAQWTDFTGQFSAVDQVDLRAQVNGYLTEIHFTDGQLVHKGDLLFVIDPRPYEIALQQAVAQYQAAIASLDLANKEVQRSTVLHRNQFESGEVLDQRTQTQQAATAAIEQAKAAIRAAQLNIEFTHITAPFSGRVSNRRVSLGALIGSGTPLTSIVSLDPIHLDFDLSEADYLAYQRFLATKTPGLDRTIQASLSDETGWQRHGDLDFIDNQVDRGSGTLHARATLPNADLLIAPGQFARLRLPMSAPRPVLLVPDAALVTDQSRKLLMTVTPDGSVVPKPVEIGAITGNQMRVITSGITPTDQVIINGLMRVRPGAKVSPHLDKLALAQQQ